MTTSSQNFADGGKTFSLMPVAIVTLLWGTNWLLFPLAVQEVSVWTFRAVNVLGSGLALLGWCRYTGQKLFIARRYWLTVGLASVFYLGIWNVASVYAALLIPTGQAAVLGFTMPFWATLGAWLLFKERPSGHGLVAIGLTGLGVALLLAKGWTSYAGTPVGFGIGLTAGVGWAIGTLILRRYPVPVANSVLTAWQLVVVGVPLSLLSLLFGSHEWFVPSWQSIAVIGYITLVPMAIGNVAWFTIVNSLPTKVSTLCPTMVPLVAMAGGALVRHEPLGVLECTAMLCCAAGMLYGLLR